ncbi:MAG: hypothetical protein IKV86_04195 [Clostridia bacterium]|nr:hypothetical protein [Clostridia bacterium]
MGCSYILSNFVGYFTIMIIASIISIVTISWVWYIIGAGIQLFSLIGLQGRMNSFGVGDDMITLWIIYVVLLVLVAFLIHLRYRNLKKILKK